jgi:hypothetical protein
MRDPGRQGVEITKEAKPYVYSVFGLRLHTDVEIPGFVPLPVKPPFDVIVSLGRFPEFLSRSIPPDNQAIYISAELGEKGGPSSRVWNIGNGDHIRVLYDDGTDCIVNRTGTQVWIMWASPYTVLDVVPYLQGPLLGLVQRLRGVTCLHASSILIGERAIAVTGPRGSGKSSTAAAFLQLGFTVLADDVVPVIEDAGQFMVRSAHPRLWLRPDMVKTLYGSSNALPQFAPSWEKRYLDLNAMGPGLPLDPKPLAAIYVLSARRDDPNRPVVMEAAPHDVMLGLLCNTYANHLLDAGMRAQEFAILSRIQRKVPVLLVHPHKDVSRISLLCQAILEDVASRVPLVGEIRAPAIP